MNGKGFGFGFFQSWSPSQILTLLSASDFQEGERKQNSSGLDHIPYSDHDKEEEEEEEEEGENQDFISAAEGDRARG